MSLFNNERLSELLEMIKNTFVLKESGKDLSTNDYTNEEKNKLAGIEANAQKNVNSFGRVTTGGGTWASADSENALLMLSAGDNMRIEMDTANDKFTFHAIIPDGNGNASGGVQDVQVGNTSVVADGVAKIHVASKDNFGAVKVDVNTGYENVAKITSLASNLNNYSFFVPMIKGSSTPSTIDDTYLPKATSTTIGGVKAGENITIDEDGTINATGGGSGGSLEPTGVTAGTYGSYTSQSSSSSYYIPIVTVDEYGRITSASQSYLGMASAKSNGLISMTDYNKFNYVLSNTRSVTLYAGQTSVFAGNISISNSYIPYPIMINATGEYTDSDGNTYAIPVKWNCRKYTYTSSFTYTVYFEIDTALEYDLSIFAGCNYYISAGK